MYTTTALTTLLLSTLALAAPAPAPALSARASKGEVHTNVRFSPITTYPGSKMETYGACATYGAPPEYKMSDAAGDMKVALDASVDDFYSYCNKTIKLTAPDGRIAVATIVDKGPGCGTDGGPYSLDLLEAVWDKVGNATVGGNVAGAKWEVID
jgi:hypothetical protein